eukprot:TRINITY_DN2864_c0_g1_i2.p1 TRINITY_DN2864_c0_g1~~TRINITY_DN2864_c0_g1_i2.p1  ORF type:complete len:337 (+),score=113.73 TRINITY_DN2864_c0_g1_i2:99-1109(+)
MVNDLPYRREQQEERRKLFSACDPNGNGFASFAEIDNILSQKYGFKQDQKMIMLDCFNQAKNLGGGTGRGADYIEAKEFRVFLELVMKALGGPSAAAAKHNASSGAHAQMQATPKNFSRSMPKIQPLQTTKNWNADLPYQRERQNERHRLFSLCDPNGNGYCSFAEIDNTLSKQFGFKQQEKMKMLECFNAVKNYTGQDRGVAGDYIESKEFRVFLELVAKALRIQPRAQHLEEGTLQSLYAMIRPEMHQAVQVWMKQAGEHEKRGMLRLARAANPGVVASVGMARKGLPSASEIPYHLSKNKSAMGIDLAGSSAGMVMMKSQSSPNLKLPSIGSY